MFLSEWCEFPSVSCLAGKISLMTAHISMLLKSRTSLTSFRACFLPGQAKVTTVHCGLNIAQDIIFCINWTRYHSSPTVFHYWIPQSAVFVICIKSLCPSLWRTFPPPNNCDLCPIELGGAKVKPFIRCNSMGETFSLNWSCEMS